MENNTEDIKIVEDTEDIKIFGYIEGIRIIEDSEDIKINTTVQLQTISVVLWPVGNSPGKVCLIPREFFVEN